MAHRRSDPTIRPRILDAADALIVRYGYRKMTVDDIAGAAGIGKGTVYLHFDGKDDVALSCLDRMAEEIADDLRSLAAETRPAVTRLRGMLTLRVVKRATYAAKHASSIDQILAALREPMLQRRARHFEREAAVLAGVLEDGVRSGELRPGDPRATSRALVTATNALLPYSLSVRELGRRAELARRAHDVVELLLAGLAPRATASTASNTRRTP